MGLSQFLDSTINVQRPTDATDTYGGVSRTMATAFAARVGAQLMSASESVQYDRRAEQVGLRLFFSTNGLGSVIASNGAPQTIAAKDQFVFTSGMFNGRTFQAVSPAMPFAGGGAVRYLAVDALEVR